MLTHLYSGKIRELYQADGPAAVLVATDRISAFDYVVERTRRTYVEACRRITGLTWNDEG